MSSLSIPIDSVSEKDQVKPEFTPFRITDGDHPAEPMPTAPKADGVLKPSAQLVVLLGPGFHDPLEDPPGL